MAQRVYLHVGTPKSGTTYLQDTLWDNRDALRDHGVLFPGRRPFDHNRASIDVRRGRHLQPDGAATWRRFCRRVRGFDGAVVLSNEWYVEASDAQLRAAVDQLGADRVHVVVTTRSPVRLVPAAWQESLKIGRGHPLDEFVRRLDRADVRWNWGVLDAAVVARRWAEAVGPDSVSVVTMPEQGAGGDLLWQRFAEVIGVDPAVAEPPGRRANESLTVEATRLLQELGPVLRAEVDRFDPSWRGQARWLRNTVVREVLTSVPGHPIGVGARLREELLARAACSVADLRDLGCRVVGDLDELTAGADRPGARHPDEVTAEELLEASGLLAAGLLRSRIEHDRGGASGSGDSDPGDPDDDQADDQDLDPGDDVEHPDGTGDHAHPGAGVGRVSGAPADSRTRRVTFMVPSAYYAGGIARTVLTCANTLVRRGYDVGIITLTRSAEVPYFDADPRIRIASVQDRFDPEDPDRLRPRVRKDRSADPELRRLDGEPSRLAEGAHKAFTALVDRRLEEELSALPPGVVVSTRPEFAVAAARWTDPRSILLHQEHLSFLPRPASLRAALRDVALGTGGRRRLDALLALTEADHERWRDYLAEQEPDHAVRTGVIPNPTPFEAGAPAPLSTKVVIAAGRFTAQKGFERLVDAWAPLARSHPDWQLRIYGTGPQHDKVARQVDALGVGDRILLPGVTSEFEQELAGSAVYAMSSRYEGLPMVLLEALSKGVPPVSFDCPEGPRQLIDSGHNGLLVPEGDVAALTDALRRLMDDDELRRRLGAGALETARAYQADAVVDRWVSLIDEVDRARTDAGS